MTSRYITIPLAALFAVVVGSSGEAFAQESGTDTGSAAALESHVSFTNAVDRSGAFEARETLYSSSQFADVPASNVGPTVMSGRVVDIDVSPFDPTHFYVAYASGGLWRTNNNGQSFTPVFDYEASMTIGAIAVRWTATPGSEVVWVGTGESNSSRSSYAGTGVYRSDDGGENWTHLGLEETHHTGTIVLHPESPDVAWVATLGHLYSSNEERGVYRTNDGGATWDRVLYVNEHTGAAWLEIDPTNPDVLYAAMWERERRAWNFVESGEGSGIYKSSDGGLTWQLLSVEGSGFPTGSGVGRIGLSVFPGNTDVIYALVDNQDHRPEEDGEDEDEGLTRDELRQMTTDAFLALDAEVVQGYLDSNRFPSKYDAATVTTMIRERKVEPVALVEFVEDANQQLFNTPVIGAELYRSDDGGASWNRTHEGYLNGLYNSYGYYFGVVAVSPQTDDEVYILGVPLLKSIDGGETFSSVGGGSVHADHQAIWLNPSRNGHVINGNDGGLNMSYDGGENWSKLNSPAVGQFYAIQVDNAKPYQVYGGLQDNGVWYGPNTYSESTRWHASGVYPYKRIAGGDGMQVEVDTRTNDIVYTGSQFGFYSRINTSTGERRSIRPQHELGERPLRFNWQTPVHLSRHSQDVVYIGANRLYRSLDQGTTLTPISDDLTMGGAPGDVPYGTLATIDESPLRFGLLYTGSDDGLVHVSKDGGVSWTMISGDLPGDRWVSRVEASNHDESRVYVTLNGYRSDEFVAYVYASDNYGQDWTRIGLDLPNEPVNVIVEDPQDENILYVGTDHGLYASIDRGSTFAGLSTSVPRAPVHDIKVQDREADLLVGTHGRSVYKIDIEEVRHVAGDVGSKSLHVFAIESQRYRESWGTRRAAYVDYSTPEVPFTVFADTPGEYQVSVLDESDRVLKNWTETLTGGLNYLDYELDVDPDKLKSRKKNNPYAEWDSADNGKTYLRPGKYRLVVGQGSSTETREFEVRDSSQ